MFPFFSPIRSHECVYGCRKAYGLDQEDKTEDVAQKEGSEDAAQTNTATETTEE